MSIQNVIQELTAVIFKKDELEMRHMSEIKPLSPLLAYGKSISDVEIIFWDAQKRSICFMYKATEIVTLMQKNEIGRVEEVEV